MRASDKRAQFVGIEAYEAAGGDVMRDLFQQDDGGWLQDPILLDRLVAEKLEREADNVRSQGWKWVEVAIDFPYGHNYGLRRISGESVAMSEEEVAAAEALRAEYKRLEQENSDVDVLPEGIDQRLGEIETALAELDERPVQYDPEEIARAGAFVSVDASGVPRVERGYVRPEDEPAIAESGPGGDAAPGSATAAASVSGDAAAEQAGTTQAEEEPEQEEGIKPIPDRLMTELTAYRTLALRDALAQDPDVALLAALHALCLKLFYRYTPESCLDIEAKCVVFGSQAPGLGDTAIAKAVDERHRRWSEQLPRESAELWDALAAFDRDSRDALFAHCIALSVNAVYEPWNRRPRALAHADRLAEAIGLDVAAAGWSPTVDTYLGRVTKARILQAVREVRGETAVQLIEHLKKGEMADRAQELLAGSGWLPEPLRTPGRTIGATPLTSEPGQISRAYSGDGDAPSTVGEGTAFDPEYSVDHGLGVAEEPLVPAE